MFQPRQILKRAPGIAGRGNRSAVKAQDASKAGERHPAMRGLDVSPVHGRHCICGRCQQHPHAA